MRWRRGRPKSNYLKPPLQETKTMTGRAGAERGRSMIAHRVDFPAKPSVACFGAVAGWQGMLIVETISRIRREQLCPPQGDQGDRLGPQAVARSQTPAMPCAVSASCSASVRALPSWRYSSGVSRRARWLSSGRLTPRAGLVGITPSDTANERMPPRRPTVRAAAPLPPSTIAFPRFFSVFGTVAVLPPATSRIKRLRSI